MGHTGTASRGILNRGLLAQAAVAVRTAPRNPNRDRREPGPHRSGRLRARLGGQSHRTLPSGGRQLIEPSPKRLAFERLVRDLTDKKSSTSHPNCRRIGWRTAYDGLSRCSTSTRALSIKEDGNLVYKSGWTRPEFPGAAVGATLRQSALPRDPREARRRRTRPRAQGRRVTRHTGPRQLSAIRHAIDGRRPAAGGGPNPGGDCLRGNPRGADLLASGVEPTAVDRQRLRQCTGARRSRRGAAERPRACLAVAGPVTTENVHLRREVQQLRDGHPHRPEPGDA